MRGTVGERRVGEDANEVKHVVWMLVQIEERSKTQESVREQVDRQLKDSLAEAQNLRCELEVSERGE